MMCLKVGLMACFVAQAAFASTCTGTITGAQTSKLIGYDPFSPAETRAQIALSVKNTSPTACVFVLKIAPRPGSQSASFPAYQLTSPQQTANTGLQPNEILLVSPKTEAGHGTPFILDVILPRGQPQAAGRYTEMLALSLMTAVNGEVLDQALLPLLCEIQPLARISLAGSGRVTTIDFQAFRQNDQRTIIIDTQATHNYTLKVKSANAGMFRLEGAPKSDTSAIRYLALLDGQDLNLATEHALNVSRIQQAQSHRLTIRVGDVTHKRAGLYKDVVTISVAPSL